jgi:hypothetical protein
MNKKNTKGQLTVGQIVLLAVGIILGVVFMTSIVNEQHLLTDAQTVTDESFSLTSCYAGSSTGNNVNESVSACNQTLNNIPSGWQVGDTTYDIFGVTITNSTGTLTLEADTDYTLFAGTGIIQYLNTSTTEGLGGNITLTDYSYYDTGYNKDSGSRGIARLISLFFALIILSFSVIGIKDWINNK